MSDAALAAPPAGLSARWSSFRQAHWLHNRLIPVAVPAYWLLLLAMGTLLPLHTAACAAMLLCSFWSDGTRRFARIFFPFLLFVIVYDSMRWYAHVIRAPVIHTREPYDFDLRFFGIRTAQGVLTPNEWTQLHTHPVLDLLCGLAYTPVFFVGETAALLIWAFFKGRQRWAERLCWVFVWANWIGYTFYYWYPAAPPWYVAGHGFEVDLTVRAYAAGALRFDKLVGLPLMEGFYGHSADVFGAVPSLHIVYPFLCAAYTWRRPRLRWVTTAYFLLVCFSAVYLDHHYILDILVGLAVALLTMWAARALFGAVTWESGVVTAPEAGVPAPASHTPPPRAA